MRGLGVGETVQLISTSGNKLVIVEQTAKKLQEINSSIRVIGVGGSSGSGKSFLLNKYDILVVLVSTIYIYFSLFKGQHEEFRERDSFGRGNKTTTGIWVSLVTNQDNSLTLLLECEGGMFFIL